MTPSLQIAIHIHTHAITLKLCHSFICQFVRSLNEFIVCLDTNYNGVYDDELNGGAVMQVLPNANVKWKEIMTIRSHWRRQIGRRFNFHFKFDGCTGTEINSRSNTVHIESIVDFVFRFCNMILWKQMVISFKFKSHKKKLFLHMNRKQSVRWLSMILHQRSVRKERGAFIFLRLI